MRACAAAGFIPLRTRHQLSIKAGPSVSWVDASSRVATG